MCLLTVMIKCAFANTFYSTVLSVCWFTVIDMYSVFVSVRERVSACESV